MSVLTDDYFVLSEDFSELSLDYEALGVEFDDLEGEHSKLQNDYQTLMRNYNSLKTSYNSLNGKYSSLKTDYDELEEQYTLVGVLSIGNSLTSYYDYLRYEFGPTGSRSYWRGEEESCQFACQLALHDLHELYWVKAEEEYGSDVGQTSCEHPSHA